MGTSSDRPAPQWLPAASTSVATTFHGMSTGTCHSCGRDADDLERVHRVYVTPEAWDTEEKVDVQDDVEEWCYPCRTHYPHIEVTD